MIFISNTVFAQKYTVYGTIRDKETGETLIGATIAIKEKNIGCISNNYGFYSISLPAGKHVLIYSFLGYKPINKEIVLNKNINIDIELITDVTNISEVVINSHRKNSNISSVKMSMHEISLKQIKSIPTVTGESDILKSLQLLPGVNTSNEGTTNLSIRGGSFDQNLILLDGAPVFNPSHALSFFSVFNTDAIKNVKIYTGAFPAKYGGRLSSVVDIRMKEGNNKKFSLSGGVGIIASRLTVEGPLINNKVSYIISGRYSYAGETVNLIGGLTDEINMPIIRDFYDKNEINFYDINAKINYKLSEKDHLYLSTYKGKDHFFYFDIDNNSSMDWGNTTTTARWNHIYNSKIFSNTTFIFSNYDYSYILKDDARHFKWSSNIMQSGLKTDYDYYANSKHNIKFGMSLNYKKFSPGQIEPRDTMSITKEFSLENKKSIDASLYFEDEYKFSDKLSVDLGLRYTDFINIGSGTVYSYSENMNNVTDTTIYGNGEIIKFYHGFEPRLSARYIINNKSSVKASYSKCKQYFHLIGNSSVGLPSDVWLPADKYIKPQRSNQYTIGYFRNYYQNMFESSIEIYYKKMQNMIDYKDNADLFLNPQIETQVLTGIGNAYGIECLIKKNTGKLTGLISYTLSKNIKQIDGINNNKPYSTRYDKRHNLSATFSYNLNEQWSFSTAFRYISGGYITIPIGSFYYYGSSFCYYSKRNQYKLPAYHRLDASISYKNKKNKTRKWKSEWVFSVYNVYARKNLFSLYVKQDQGDLETIQAYKMYLFSTVPTITYNFKF